MVEEKHFIVKLLGTRPEWPENMTSREEEVMEDHFQYLKELTAQKKVLLAGPCFEPIFGLIILQTATDAEALALMENEPSVKAGLHTYQMSPMKVSLLAENLNRN